MKYQLSQLQDSDLMLYRLLSGPVQANLNQEHTGEWRPCIIKLIFSNCQGALKRLPDSSVSTKAALSQRQMTVFVAIREKAAATLVYTQGSSAHTRHVHKLTTPHSYGEFQNVPKYRRQILASNHNNNDTQSQAITTPTRNEQGQNLILFLNIKAVGYKRENTVTVLDDQFTIFINSTLTAFLQFGHFLTRKKCPLTLVCRKSSLLSGTAFCLLPKPGRAWAWAWACKDQ